PGGKVVQQRHVISIGQQSLGQVRADEPGAAGDQDSLRSSHLQFLRFSKLRSYQKQPPNALWRWQLASELCPSGRRSRRTFSPTSAGEAYRQTVQQATDSARDRLAKGEVAPPALSRPAGRRSTDRKANGDNARRRRRLC